MSASRSWAIRALAGATIAAVLALGLATEARGDASLESWVSAYCSNVGYYFSFANTAPAVAAGDDASLSVRRYLSDLAAKTNALRMGAIGAPPVAAARKLRAPYEGQLQRALTDFARASELMKKPRLTVATVRAVVGNLSRGHDDVLEAVQHLHGNTGNARFDAAMRAQKRCDFITQLEPLAAVAQA